MEKQKREELVEKFGEATVNIIIPLLDEFKSEDGKPIIQKLLGENNKDEHENDGEIVLSINGISTAIKGNKKERKIEGRVENFVPSVLKVVLRMISQSEDEEDRKHPNQYWNGLAYVDYPEGLSDFEKAMLKTRFVKQLFTDAKRGGDSHVTGSAKEVVALSSLIMDIGKRLRLLENGKPKVKPQLGFNDMRLGNTIREREKIKGAQHEGRIQARKTEKAKTEGEGQLGMTNVVHEEHTAKGVSFSDAKLRDFAKRK